MLEIAHYTTIKKWRKFSLAALHILKYFLLQMSFFLHRVGR